MATTHTKKLIIQRLIEPEQSELSQRPKAEIQISRGGKTHGPYDREAIERFLEEKRVSLRDFAWISGMDEWARLEDVLREMDEQTPTA